MAFFGTGGSEDGADAHCVRCGGKIYFQVGPGDPICPACGKPWQHTDEEIEEHLREMSKPIDWEAQLRRDVDNFIQSLEMMYDAPPDLVDPRTRDNALRAWDSEERVLALADRLKDVPQIRWKDGLLPSAEGGSG
jgi:uncharacterized Zn finger protein (UPF0148 family)